VGGSRPFPRACPSDPRPAWLSSWDDSRGNVRADGAWRSLVARLLWEQEVAGSSPAAPTTPSDCPLPRGELVLRKTFELPRWKALSAEASRVTRSHSAPIARFRNMATVPAAAAVPRFRRWARSETSPRDHPCRETGARRRSRDSTRNLAASRGSAGDVGAESHRAYLTMGGERGPFRGSAKCYAARCRMPVGATVGSCEGTRMARCD
jgi:hypothetical protein